MKESKQIQFKIVNDDSLPPMMITKDGAIGITVVLNQHHVIWLGLHRNTIPGIAQNIQSKLTEMCDGFLTEQLMYSEDWE